MVWDHMKLDNPIALDLICIHQGITLDFVPPQRIIRFSDNKKKLFLSTYCYLLSLFYNLEAVLRRKKINVKYKLKTFDNFFFVLLIFYSFLSFSSLKNADQLRNTGKCLLKNSHISKKISNKTNYENCSSIFYF